MTEGVWYDSSIYTTYGAQYWAFDVPASLAGSCPMIRFEMQVSVGTLSAFISARTIPTSGEYDFTRSFSSHSWSTICPSHPAFYYGRYYVNIANAAARSTNIYRMRFSIIQSPTCLGRDTLPPPGVTETAPANAVPSWIPDGVMQTLVVSPTANINNPRFFKMYAPGRCTNVSAAVYRTNPTQDWPFIYLSTANGIPTEASLATTIAYQRVPEAWINIQYCNPNASQDYNIFYFAIMPRTTGNLQFVLTTDQYIPPIALSSLSYSANRQEIMYGAAPSLNCPNAQQVCRYFGYRGCEASGISQCCYHFLPIPAEQNVQAMWPWNTADTSVGQFHQNIDWTDMQPIVPGKMAWALNMEWSDANTRTVYLDVDPGQCNITLGRGFVNSRYEPLTDLSISFTPKQLDCDYETYINVSNRIQALTETYIDGTAVDTDRETGAPASAANSKNTVAAVALQQLRIAIASWNDGYIGCQDMIFDRFANVTQNYNESESYAICNHFPGTAAWRQDACCNADLLPTVSCRPTVVPQPLPILGSVRKSAMESNTCENPQCSQSAVEALIYTNNHIQDPSSGCLAALGERASVELATDRLAFTYSCINDLLGDDLLGVRCSSTDDCRTIANETYFTDDASITCDSKRGRCNFTPQNVLNCMAHKVDIDTALGLFSQWGIAGKPDVASLYSAFESRWLRSQCTGPNALRYRAGFRFTLLTPGCEDYCNLNNLEPSCVDTSKSRTEACEVPTVCDFSVNTSRAICWRTWQPTTDDAAGCLSSKICNWRRNDTYPCPYSSSEDCTDACEDSSLSEFVCADCTKDITNTCLEIESITDENTCNAGLCTTDSSITDAATCEATGTCSGRCVGCDQAQCESVGACSDYVAFKPLADAGIDGVCIARRNYSAQSGVWSCPTGFTNIGWTCANMNASFNESSCSAAPFWFYTSWYEFATSAETCASNSGSFCFQRSINSYTYRNISECNVCGADCIWTTPYTWGPAIWTPGRMQPLSWFRREYVSQASMTETVDLKQATADVNEAITRDFAFAYYTDALCRYDSRDDLVTSVVCDCATSDASNCFQNRAQAAVGSIRVCPFQYRSLGTAVAIVTVPSTAAVTQTSCKILTVSETSVGKYQVPPDHSVTHALFNKIIENPFLIVVNDKDAIVGQLISDAATVNFDFTPDVPIQICVLVEEFLDIDKSLTHYTLARIQSDNSIEVYDSSNLASEAANVTDFTYDTQFEENSSTRNRICGYTKTSGTFFAVAVVPNYKLLNPKPSGETIAAATLYSALLAMGLIQGLMLFIDRARQVKLLAFKFVAVTIVCVNAAIRVAYVLLPSNRFKKGTESLQFILFEAPTFFCFSVFTVIVYLWAMIVMTTRNYGKRGGFITNRTLRNLFILSNVFMYAVFVVFIYLLAILPAKTKESPCFLGNLDSAITDVERTIKIAYWIYQMVIAVILAVGFTCTVIFMIRILLSLSNARGSRSTRARHNGSRSKSSSLSGVDDDEAGNGTSNSSRTRHHSGHHEPRTGRDSVQVQMLIITIVAFVCVVFLLVRAAIFLDVAINSSTLHVIVFCILEVIPQAMLLFYLHPFRCFREAGRKTSTRNSGVSPYSHTRSNNYSTSNTRSINDNNNNSMAVSPSATSLLPKKQNDVELTAPRNKKKSNPASAVASSSNANGAPSRHKAPSKSTKTGQNFTDETDDEESSTHASSSSESRSENDSLASSSSSS